MIRLFNTLTRKSEEFVPLNPSKVGMYTCGPTVYNFQHIGNFRTMIFADVLSRMFEANGYEVTTVRNITDIDDKIIRGAKEHNLPIEEFSKEYEKAFFEDLSRLNVLPVTHSPHATGYVKEMIKYIEDLIEKGLAYTEDDGSVYFDISEFPGYGKLSGIEKRELKTGTRILSDEYTKDDVQDFALWKSVDAGESGGYDSPWGLGRPGWHIECSVMSQTLLGDTLDIHTGGIDLLFPHHENEIAQSEGKTGKPFVKFFIHGEHILVENEKMSKSKGNFYLLKDLEERKFDPLAFRYLVLTAHYRDKLNFTWESLQASQNALNNLRDEVREWGVAEDQTEPEESEKYFTRFLSTVSDDLATPKAMAVLWELVKSDLPPEEKARIILKMDRVLGLNLADFVGKKIEIPEDVSALVEARENARKQKDFSKSDELRKEIHLKGFDVEDTAEGPRVRLIH